MEQYTITLPKHAITDGLKQAFREWIPKWIAEKDITHVKMISVSTSILELPKIRVYQSKWTKQNGYYSNQPFRYDGKWEKVNVDVKEL